MLFYDFVFMKFNRVLLAVEHRKIDKLQTPIEAVTVHHIGTYACMAENAAQVTEQSSELNVNGSARYNIVFSLIDIF
jgi:hypothetical protein